MKCLKILGLLLVTSSAGLSMSLGDSTARSAFKQIEVLPASKNDESNDVNSLSMDVLDVRTPPKIKEEIMNKHHIIEFETSHAGIAIPVVDEVILEDNSTPKSKFKQDRSTTTTSTGGLSTWILLSGQSSGTTKAPMKKPVIKPVTEKLEVNGTLFVGDKPHRIIKPIFKRKNSTPRPTTTTTKKIIATKMEEVGKNLTTPKPHKITNKIKASVLNNAVNKKNNTVLVRKTNTTTLIAVTTTHKNSNVNATTTPSPPKTSKTTIKTNVVNSAALPAEAKNGESDLPAEDKKKNKKKKNKNRRRKPAKEHKQDSTDLEALKPVSTQLYSYLRSEIIPVTVGVSLVGLLVTAGLASYYLQPFGLLRRSDTPPVDRKDPPGEYYYQDQYSGGIPEEDAIGKVIAGMPEDVLQGTSYKSPTTRSSQFVNQNNNNNVRYRHVDRRSQIQINPYGTVEDVNLAEQAVPMYGTNTQNQYVVGSVPKEAVQEVTPAAVPEHGPRNFKEGEKKFVVGNLPQEYLQPGGSPRNLKIRRRRDLKNEQDNEIADDNAANTFINDKLDLDSTTTKVIDTTTTKVDVSTTSEPTEIMKNETAEAIINLFTDIFRLKLKLGLELVQNITQGVNSYLTAVENKLNQYNETIILTSTVAPKSSKFEGSSKRIRIRRDVLVNDNENEIFPEDETLPKFTATASTTVAPPETSTDSYSTTTSGIWHVNEKRPSIMELVKELFRTKLRMGLEFIGKVSRTVSTYVEKVQSRLNENYNVSNNTVESKGASKPRR